jgi:hypothetical protein
MRLILIVISIRFNYGSEIIILVALDGRRENKILKIHEMLFRLINEDFTLNPQETGGEIVKR